MQVLQYPILDAGMQTESYKLFARGYMLTADAMRYFVDAYLPDVSRRAEPLASPLRAPSDTLAGGRRSSLFGAGGL